MGFFFFPTHPLARTRRYNRYLNLQNFLFAEFFRWKFKLLKSGNKYFLLFSSLDLCHYFIVSFFFLLYSEEMQRKSYRFMGIFLSIKHIFPCSYRNLKNFAVKCTLWNFARGGAFCVFKLYKQVLLAWLGIRVRTFRFIEITLI